MPVTAVHLSTNMEILELVQILGLSFKVEQQAVALNELVQQWLAL